MARCEECGGSGVVCWDGGNSPAPVETPCMECGGSGEGDNETYELAARRERECREAFTNRVLNERAWKGEAA